MGLRCWKLLVITSQHGEFSISSLSASFSWSSNAYYVKIRPDPTPGETLELGFLGTVLQVEIPHSLDVQQVTETSSFNEKYDPKSHVSDLASIDEPSS